MRFSKFSTAFARARSQRSKARRSIYQFTPVMLDRLESRVVLSAVDPVLAKPYIHFTPLQNAEFEENNDGLVDEVCIEVWVDPSFFTKFGNDATVEVGFASYIAYGGTPEAFDLTEQVYLDSATTTLTMANDSSAESVELCVAVDDFHCTQIDVFTGSVVFEFTLDGRTTGYHDYNLTPEGVLGYNRLLQGAIVSPSGVILTPGPGELTPTWQDGVLEDCHPHQSGEGLTPGYWKNHLDDWQVLSPDMTLGEVFGDHVDAYGLADKTLIEALNFGGGPSLAHKARILMRQAVAALLNAYHSDVDYDLSATQVILAVQNALDSGNQSTILSLKDQLDVLNNQGNS